MDFVGVIVGCHDASSHFPEKENVRINEKSNHDNADDIERDETAEQGDQVHDQGDPNKGSVELHGSVGSNTVANDLNNADNNDPTGVHIFKGYRGFSWG